VSVPRPERDRLWERLQQGCDVLVVGGGITGAGVALDAASRGYRVALIDRGDYASGTTSRSTKLVHGGLRYLKQWQFGLVREALQALVASATPPRPRLPLFKSGHPGLAERVDEALAGFGET